MTNSIESRCIAIIDQLELRPPITMNSLLTEISRYVGRPITLHMAETPPAVCGLLVRKNEQEHVIVDVADRPIYQLHTFAHELGHVVLDHPVDGPFVDADMLTELALAMSSDEARHLFGNEVFGPWCEDEAETFADLLVSRAVALTSSAQRPEGVPSEGLAAAFDHRRPRTD